jgi:uncharacterized protein (TIGR03546 family)
MKRPFRFLYQALTAERSSRQIALGIALGVVIGLLPKGNLVALSFVFLLFALRTNLAAGFLAAGSCSWIGVGLDPISHRLGEVVLTFAPLQGWFASIYKLPLVPWTSLNNTVVMGSLIIGLVQFGPTYFWCRRLLGDRSTRERQGPDIPPPKSRRVRRKQRRFLISADAAS